MAMKIGELAERADCLVQTIRYYEKEGLLPAPSRSAGKFRLYTESHVERLQFIRHCRSLAMPLDEVRTLLKYRDVPDQDCRGINALLDEQIRKVEVRVAELQELRRHLVALRELCPGERPTTACGVLQGLSDLTDHASTSPGTTPY
ncbi:MULTISPECIES: Cd(II)/Pb(II)-responsive transcriptional regulator [Cupriavidus]